ncbi:hypothetical protein GCM10010129_58150 [Streptomyces fumigatiscleroticus]|nr:hypothetical protein GCM10010129_58150 [Streptomyces fumigatiscleroticus]
MSISFSHTPRGGSRGRPIAARAIGEGVQKGRPAARVRALQASSRAGLPGAAVRSAAKALIRAARMVIPGQAADNLSRSADRSPVKWAGPVWVSWPVVAAVVR